MNKLNFDPVRILLSVLWEKREKFDRELLAPFNPIPPQQDDQHHLDILFGLISDLVHSRENSHLLYPLDEVFLYEDFLQQLDAFQFTYDTKMVRQQVGKAFVLLNNVLNQNVVNQNSPFNSQATNLAYFSRAIDDISFKPKEEHCDRLMKHIYASPNEFRNHEKVIMLELENSDFCKKYYETKLPINQISRFRKNKIQIASKLLGDRFDQLYSN